MNINELKEILENAPEGFTHIDEDKDYWRINDQFMFECSDKSMHFDIDDLKSSLLRDFRLLSDIKTIVELHEQLEEVKKAQKVLGHLNRNSKFKRFTAQNPDILQSIEWKRPK